MQLTHYIPSRVPTVQEINDLVSNIESAVNNGEMNSVSLIVMCKALTELCDRLRKSPKIKRDFIDQVDRGETEFQGAKVEKAETGTRYDFSACRAWQEQKTQVNRETEILKEIEALCKVVKAPTKTVLESTGEEIIAHPAIKRSTTSPKITLKK